MLCALKLGADFPRSPDDILWKPPGSAKQLFELVYKRATQFNLVDGEKTNFEERWSEV